MSKDKKRNPRPVIDNRQARYNFELLESFEAGLALEGWEVKGIRSGEVDMKDSYVLMKDGEAWILGLKISPPKEVTFQVDQNRTKKLLLTKSELGKIFKATQEKGLTCVPTIIFWNPKYWELETNSKIDFDILKDAKILFYDPFKDSSTENEEKVELEELLKTSDFISIHVPKNKETINLVSKEKLSIAKEGSIIINTSRGGLIDEQEVFNLVNENKLYSAGFDVYEKEPPEMNEEKNRSKVITLPHLGASTKEAQARAGQQLVENIKNILNEDLSSVVNKNLK